MNISNTESEVYKVGDKVYSTEFPMKKGKITAEWNDNVLQKWIMQVEWSDGTTEITLTDWVTKTDPWSLWRPIEETGFKKDKEEIRGNETTLSGHENIENVEVDKVELYKDNYSKMKKGSVDVTNHTLTQYLPFICAKLSSDLRISDKEVEDIVISSDHKLLKDNRILLENDKRAIISTIDDPITVEYYRNYRKCTAQEFLSDNTQEFVKIESSGNDYIIDWYGDKYLIEHDELGGFIRDYSLDADKVKNSLKVNGSITIMLG